MNKDRAIQMLERMQDPEPYEPQITSEAFDALQMAIEALSSSEVPNSSDTISRQAAIEKILGQPPEAHYPSWYARQIEDLPPAQPKRGKWNRLDMDTLNCNKCGATFVLNQGSEKMHFCLNCGADMREVTT